MAVRRGGAAWCSGLLLAGACLASSLVDAAAWDAAPATPPAPATMPPAASGGDKARELKAAIEEVRRRLERQRQAAGAPAAAGGEPGAARERAEGLAQALAGLRAERDELRHQLMVSRDELAAARAGAGDEAERKEAADRLAASRAEADRLRSVAAGGEETRRGLARENETLRRRVARLEVEAGKLRAEVEAGRAELELARARSVAAAAASADGGAAPVVVLDGALFEAGGDRLDPAAAADPLARVAERIRDGGGGVRIVGHADAAAAGGAEGNRALSLRLAEAVRDYLAATHAVEPGRMAVEGRGGEAAGGVAGGGVPGRRVEVFVAAR